MFDKAKAYKNGAIFWATLYTNTCHTRSQQEAQLLHSEHAMLHVRRNLVNSVIQVSK